MFALAGVIVWTILRQPAANAREVRTHGKWIFVMIGIIVGLSLCSALIPFYEARSIAEYSGLFSVLVTSAFISQEMLMNGISEVLKVATMAKVGIFLVLICAFVWQAKMTMVYENEKDELLLLLNNLSIKLRVILLFRNSFLYNLLNGSAIASDKKGDRATQLSHPKPNDQM